jgi:hypothetical protein
LPLSVCAQQAAVLDGSRGEDGSDLLTVLNHGIPPFPPQYKRVYHKNATGCGYNVDLSTGEWQVRPPTPQLHGAPRMP